MDAIRVLSKGPGGTDYDAEVERLLSCPICLEVYSKPVVILPCQHNLCRKCANDVFQNRGTPMGSGGRFRCPTCRYEVMLDRHGVYGLQRNLLVENIIDMYQSESKKPFRKLEVLMCEEHEDEKVNIFCLTCQKPTCSLCKVFGQHHNCTVSPVEKVYKDHKTEISAAIAMLVAGNDRLQNVISSTEELVTKTEENSKAAQTTVSAAFDILYSILEERKQSMLSRIKSVAEEKKQGLQEVLKQYGTQLEKSSKLVEEALSLLEEPSVPQFLSVSRELINRVTTTARATDVKKPPSNVHDMTIFDINFSQLEVDLRSINFTEADAVDGEFEEIGNTDESSAADATVTTTTGGSFRAKLLLPKDDDAAEVVASAEVTKGKADTAEESDGGASTGSRSDAIRFSQGRKDSGNSLDELDSDVKAIAEKYLAERASRPSSQSSRRSGSSSSNRRKSYSDEKNRPLEQDSRWESAFRGTSSGNTQTFGSRTTPASSCSRRFNSGNGHEDHSRSSTRSNSPVLSQERIRATRTPLQNMETQDEDLSPTELQESSEALIARIPQRNMRSARRLPRTYTTHRRRTWSHLLDRK